MSCDRAKKFCVPGGQKKLRAAVSWPGQDRLWAPTGLSLGSGFPRNHPSSLFFLRCPQSPEPRFPPRTYGVHGQLGGGPGTQQPCPGAQQRQRGPHRGAKCPARWSDLGAQPAGGRWGDASLRPGDTGYFPAPSLLCTRTPDLFLEGKALKAGPVVKWEGCSVPCMLHLRKPHLYGSSLTIAPWPSPGLGIKEQEGCPDCSRQISGFVLRKSHCTYLAIFFFLFCD